MAAGKRLVDFPEATPFPAADILTQPCDVLIPAAIGGVITGARLQPCWLEANYKIVYGESGGLGCGCML